MNPKDSYSAALWAEYFYHKDKKYKWRNDMAQIDFEYYQDRKKEWRWRLRNVNNGKIVGDSGEGYKNKTDCLDEIVSIKLAVPHADIKQVQK